nr:hypothetical protein [Tanacetum cinerariifolium]
MSIDDLYNNFKIVEQEAKRTVTTSSSSGSQNTAFLSSPGSTNEVKTTNIQVSTVSTPVSTASTHDNTANLSDATVYAFLANQPNGSQLVHEDLEQIHEDDLEEIDLKWQLALLSMRARRNAEVLGTKKAGQEIKTAQERLNVEDTSSKAMVAIDGACFDWSYMADDEAPTNTALMAFSDSEDKSEVMVLKSDNVQHKPEQANQPWKVSQNPKNNITNWNELRTRKLGVGFQFTKKACFMCGSFSHLIKDCDFHDKKIVQKPVLKNMEKGTSQREVRPVWNNTMRINHQNFSNSKRNLSPTTVLTKSEIVPISTARQSSSRAAAPVIVVRLINTVAPKPLMNVAKHRQNALQRSHSLSRRPFYQKIALKNRNLNNKINTAKRPKIKVQDHVSKNSRSYICKRFNYVDPEGRLKHMTGNISYLTDFKEHDEGYVAFGGGPKGGKITDKGTIRTGKLDFEDVYFVNELEFNLYSVLQMCDKKNSVLFTETECFVLSPNFKLADESHVLLKVPRKNNMYSFDMKNIVPQKDLTCLLAKATNDESILWHMRLENLVDKKVKIIRCDNGTEFKNRVMNEFCEEKGIKREYSMARTPQQNEVAERINRTLIEVARTMLADSKLPTIFWAEAVNTACYVQNRVLVLGKFDGKSDEGICVGYSTISKAFRVYNTRTRKVEENLHITFLENKPMIACGGPEWLFDIDAFSESMNYAPVPACINSNDFADSSLFDSPSQDSDGHNKDKHGPSQESKCDNQKRPDAESSTKNVNTTRPSINTANTNDNAISLNINAISPPVNTATPTYTYYPSDPLMPDLEDTGIFDDGYDDRDEDDELSERELKQIEANDQAIQTILPGLPEDIYAAVDSCETAQEIWLRVQQMMKGSDIGIQEKKAKLFNEWERFTSNEWESIESYYHRFLKLMNDLKRNKHFPEKIASNLKFLNNLQPEWSRHVTIVHQTKDLHTADYTQLYDFLKNQVAQNRRVQNVGNQNGLIGVQGHGNQNPIGNSNLVAVRAEGNAAGHGNQIRCYNCRGVGYFARDCTVRPRRRDAA